jgi:hypothetical protein
MDDWLKSLKAGDEVCYKVGYNFESYITATITKITPSGIIRTSRDLSFNPDGRSIGDGYYARLVLYDDNLKARLHKENLMSMIGRWVNNSGLNGLTVEQLEAICEIVGISETCKEKERS